MGTRADFYLGRGAEAKWIGSIAWDGYPEGKRVADVMKSSTQEDFVAAVAAFADEVSSFSGQKKGDFTSPEMGWPWPWESSHMTDFAYMFDDGQCWVSNFGSALAPAAEVLKEGFEFPDGKGAVFPVFDTSGASIGGPRSGLLVVGIGSGGKVTVD
jgi:hypothetical protein